MAVAEKEYLGTGQIVESGNVNNYLGLPNTNGYDLGEKFREHAVLLEVPFIEKEVTQITITEESSKKLYQIRFKDDTVEQARAVIYTSRILSFHLRRIY